MTELEKQTLRADLLDVIGRCQQILLRIGTDEKSTDAADPSPSQKLKTSVAEACRHAIASMEGTFSSRDVRRWLFENGYASNLPNSSVISTALSNLAKRNELTIVRRGGFPTKNVPRLKTLYAKPE